MSEQESQQPIMAYTLREVPRDLHSAWKAAAALRGLSMRAYAIIALSEKVKRDFQAYRKEVESIGADSKSQGDVR